jgi:hypothetical protein
MYFCKGRRIYTADLCLSWRPLLSLYLQEKYLLAPRFPHKFLPNPGVSNMTDQSCFPPLSLSLYLIFLYIFIYLTGGKCPLLVLRHVFCLNKPLHYMMTPLSMLKNNLLRCSMCGFSSITLHCAVFELGHAISFFSFSSFLLHEVQGYFFSFFYLFIFYFLFLVSALIWIFFYCWGRNQMIQCQRIATRKTLGHPRLSWEASNGFFCLEHVEFRYVPVDFVSQAMALFERGSKLKKSSIKPPGRTACNGCPTV